MARSSLATAAAALRAHALAKPHATEHFPWGETAIKVNGKVFLFMHVDASSLGLSTKLPTNHAVALMLPFAEPTGYGLGKAGWVSARFAATDAPPTELLCDWIDESYLAVAPAKFARLADAVPTKPAAKKSAKTPAAKAKTKAAKSATKPAAKAKPAEPAAKAKHADAAAKAKHAEPAAKAKHAEPAAKAKPAKPVAKLSKASAKRPARTSRTAKR